MMIAQSIRKKKDFLFSPGKSSANERQLELKNTIFEMKIFLNMLKNKLYTAREKMRDLDMTIETNLSK